MNFTFFLFSFFQFLCVLLFVSSPANVGKVVDKKSLVFFAFAEVAGKFDKNGNDIIAESEPAEEETQEEEKQQCNLKTREDTVNSTEATYLSKRIKGRNLSEKNDGRAEQKKKEKGTKEREENVDAYTEETSVRRYPFYIYRDGATLHDLLCFIFDILIDEEEEKKLGIAGEKIKKKNKRQQEMEKLRERRNVIEKLLERQEYSNYLSDAFTESREYVTQHKSIANPYDSPLGEEEEEEDEEQEKEKEKGKSSYLAKNTSTVAFAVYTNSSSSTTFDVSSQKYEANNGCMFLPNHDWFSKKNDANVSKGKAKKDDEKNKRINLKNIFSLKNLEFDVLEIAETLLRRRYNLMKKNDKYAIFRKVLAEKDILTFQDLCAQTNLYNIILRVDVFDELFTQVQALKHLSFNYLSNKNKDGYYTNNSAVVSPSSSSFSVREGEHTCDSMVCVLRKKWEKNADMADVYVHNNRMDKRMKSTNQKDKGDEDNTLLKFLSVGEVSKGEGQFEGKLKETMGTWHRNNKANFIVSLGNLFSSENTERVFSDMFNYEKLTPQNAKNTREFLYSDADEEKETDGISSIPWYNVLSDEDSYFNPSAQIRRHYLHNKHFSSPFSSSPQLFANKTDAWNLPNDYYKVTYVVPYTDEEGKKQEMRVLLVFINTWIIGGGFPLEKSLFLWNKQLRWLYRTLTEGSKSSDWMLVFGHHPIRGTGVSISQTLAFTSLNEALFRGGAHAYVAGQTNHAEIIQLWDNPFRYVTTGAATHKRYGYNFKGKLFSYLQKPVCMLLRASPWSPSICYQDEDSVYTNDMKLTFFAFKFSPDNLQIQTINSLTGKVINKHNVHNRNVNNKKNKNIVTSNNEEKNEENKQNESNKMQEEKQLKKETDKMFPLPAELSGVTSRKMHAWREELLSSDKFTKKLTLIKYDILRLFREIHEHLEEE